MCTYYSYIKWKKIYLYYGAIDHPLLLKIEITSRHADKEYFFLTWSADYSLQAFILCPGWI